MLIDSSVEPVGVLPEFDLCIVGSGPAGLTLAREMARAGRRICILESGGEKPAENTQDLNSAQVNSEHGYRGQPLRDGRRRQLGGSANLWNHELRGELSKHIRYVQLDESDFEKRDWVPESGWPFTRKELQPYYDRAAAVCGIAPFRNQAEDWKTGDRKVWRTSRVESVISQFGSAHVFLEDYRRELIRHERVTILLHASALELRMEPLSRRITSVKVGSGENAFEVRSKTFVLAAGGLENARILLLQNAIQPGGLGNQNDMVGRCFMDHPSITLGTLRPDSAGIFRQAGFYDQHNVDGQPIMGKLHIRPAVQRREKMLNLCAVLVPHFSSLRENIPAVLRQLIVKGPKFLWQRRSASAHCYSPVNGEPAQSLRQRLLEGYYSECFCGWSRLGKPEKHFGEFGVRSLVEQSPDRANRVELDLKLDALGQRKLKVHWKWNEIDLRSVRRAQEIFREELAVANIGTFIPTPENVGQQPRAFFSPHHFMGTTRMHENPRNGVVNANCRVHDVPNLYVTGSSVFPTGGFANPTFTIIALAIKLADHLQKDPLTTNPKVVDFAFASAADYL